MSRFFRDKLPHKAAQPPWRVKHAYLPRGAGWSHAVAVRMDVMSGRPVASVFAEKGEKKSIVITLLTLEGFFMFFIHDAPHIVELGELTRMVMERRVPFGLFTALLDGGGAALLEGLTHRAVKASLKTPILSYSFAVDPTKGVEDVRLPLTPLSAALLAAAILAAGLVLTLTVKRRGRNHP